MNVAGVLIGIAVLALGRKLFWLFVGAVGFIVGMNVAARQLAGRPEWVVLLAALVTGLLGILLAIVLQRVAVAVAGFIGGGYLVVIVLDALGRRGGPFSGLLFIIGGVIGAVLVATFFDRALIVLSSLVGAALVSQAFALPPPPKVILLLVLFIVGCIVQTRLMEGERTTGRASGK